MFLAFGWFVIQSSQEIYVGSNSDNEDEFENIVNEKDEILIKEMEIWLQEKQSQNSLFKYQFSMHLNNHSGLLQFHTSRNHYCSFTKECVEHIAGSSKGSYGLVHVHDNKNFEHGLEVWRVLDGRITKQNDEFFSPFKSPHAFGGTNFWVES